MMLMEAELTSLKQDKLQLQQQLDAVNRSLISAEEQLTQQLNTKVGQLTQQAVDINITLTEKMNTEVDQLTQQAVNINITLTQQTVDINQTMTQRCSDLEAIQQRDKASLSHMIQGGCSGPVLIVWCTPQTGVGVLW